MPDAPVRMNGLRWGMAFCDHCQGQRFDRSRVLRKLRGLRKQLQNTQCEAKVDEALLQAVNAVRALDIPHFDMADDFDDEIVH
jgi:hypothetical protein